MDRNNPFVIHVELAQARAWFERLHGRGAHLGGLMRDIGEILTKSTQRRFRDGVGPDGIPWQPLADGSGRAPLLDTGRMRDEIFPTSGEDWAQISATAKQARWHQFGTDPRDSAPGGCYGGVERMLSTRFQRIWRLPLTAIGRWPRRCGDCGVRGARRDMVRARGTTRRETLSQ